MHRGVRQRRGARGISMPSGLPPTGDPKGREVESGRAVRSDEGTGPPPHRRTRTSSMVRPNIRHFPGVGSKTDSRSGGARFGSSPTGWQKLCDGLPLPGRHLRGREKHPYRPGPPSGYQSSDLSESLVLEGCPGNGARPLAPGKGRNRLPILSQAILPKLLPKGVPGHPQLPGGSALIPPNPIQS